jgi:hypothetical protein
VVYGWFDKNTFNGTLRGVKMELSEELKHLNTKKTEYKKDSHLTLSIMRKQREFKIPGSRYQSRHRVPTLYQISRKTGGTIQIGKERC